MGGCLDEGEEFQVQCKCNRSGTNRSSSMKHYTVLPHRICIPMEREKKTAIASMSLPEGRVRVCPEVDSDTNHHTIVPRLYTGNEAKKSLLLYLKESYASPTLVMVVNCSIKLVINELIVSLFSPSP